MSLSRLIGLGFLIACVAIVVAMALGRLAPNAPLEFLPTSLPNVPNIGSDEVVTVRVSYGTEKEQWLEESVERWLATNPSVNGRLMRVELEGEGSQQMVAGLRDGSLRPTVASPASTVQIRQINATPIEGRRDIPADSAPLVRTPLVVAAWEPGTPDEPVAGLKSGDAEFWDTLQRQVVEHSADRTFLFGQTDPNSSNSGLQTFVLMACAYHGKRSGLTVQDIENPGFREWMSGYAQGVERFGDSTGTFMDDMVRYGPSRYSAVAVYESSALSRIEAAEGRMGEIRLLYPPENLMSDHPYAVLDAPWVTPEEREAALQLRQFLLSEEEQRRAIRFGFRPANEEVPLDSPGSPFEAYEQYGARTETGPQVEEPSAEVTEALMDLWSELESEVNR